MSRVQDEMTAIGDLAAPRIAFAASVRIIADMLLLHRLSVVFLGAVLISGCTQQALRAKSAGPVVTTQPAKPEVADEVLAAYSAHTVERDGEVVLRYRLLAPAPQTESLPLVILLHGAGERGDDNYRQLIHGGAEMLHHVKRHPAYYVFPQCPKGTWWDGQSKLYEEKTPYNGPAPMDELAKLIDAIMSSKPIDSGRVYIMGLSMGGFGTFELVARRPLTFAAAIPMCGGGDVNNAPKYTQTPFWIFHGDADTAVKVQYSRDMVAAMKIAGVNVIYTEYPNGNHNAWTPTMTNDAVIDWMFAQRRRWGR
jgi:predicted peptidase